MLNAEQFSAAVVEAGFVMDDVINTLPDDADARLGKAVTDFDGKLRRLEPVNLAAIAEYGEAAQRKEYLDAQNTDLTTALETLEDAIRKIDRETRGRFKDTFDRVNSGVQDLYPRLFGGGHAYLELTGEDLLDTGVSIMARPPGKRVSNISLLSGGEKAMTAVALVFAIFRLNPAPFCLLDEVDAPLDEANVGRFTNMVTRDERAGTVPVRDPQQGDDGSRAAVVRRDHARARRQPPGVVDLERRHVWRARLDVRFCMIAEYMSRPE